MQHKKHRHRNQSIKSQNHKQSVAAKRCTNITTKQLPTTLNTTETEAICRAKVSKTWLGDALKHLTGHDPAFTEESTHTELVPPGNLIKPGSDLTDVTVIVMMVIMMRIRVCGDMLPYGKLAAVNDDDF
ncbi:hypothetical protein Tco_0139720 [Tanacetum coccineum]